ncbi:MAG TPA: riboflavin synthase [Candidatus Binatia bacterium]|nr:riboflavin synthase [Candidatus Binatia bacterium]
MFTGLIEDAGKIKSTRKGEHSLVLTISTDLPVRVMKLGASVAVNGACLTIVKRGRGDFTVDVSPETLSCTNLQELRAGSLVNLERPMRLGGELGGHLVTGHVDAVATVAAIQKEGEFTFYSFHVPPKIAALLVPKGSVAVDGISLTVNECTRRRFSVAIIPFTLQHTNLRARRVGDNVNIETDLIGKYVHSFMANRA